MWLQVPIDKGQEVPNNVLQVANRLEVYITGLKVLKNYLTLSIVTGILIFPAVEATPSSYKLQEGFKKDDKSILDEKRFDCFLLGEILRQ